jgi:hypothetical protein
MADVDPTVGVLLSRTDQSEGFLLLNRAVRNRPQNLRIETCVAGKLLGIDLVALTVTVRNPSLYPNMAGMVRIKGTREAVYSYLSFNLQRNPVALRNLGIDVGYKSRGVRGFRYVTAMTAIRSHGPNRSPQWRADSHRKLVHTIQLQTCDRRGGNRVETVELPRAPKPIKVMPPNEVEPGS